jgi:hypothetical protein
MSSFVDGSDHGFCATELLPLCEVRLDITANLAGKAKDDSRLAGAISGLEDGPRFRVKYILKHKQGMRAEFALAVNSVRLWECCCIMLSSAFGSTCGRADCETSR